MIIQIVTAEETRTHRRLISLVRETAGRAGRARRVHAKESFTFVTGARRGGTGGKGGRIISACGTSALDG